MPIIFPFTNTGAAIALILFFVSLIYCGLTALYLDGEKTKRHTGLRISIVVAVLLCFYCEWCSINIGFTLNPPKNANIECVED